MDDWGSVKHLWATTGVYLTHRQKHGTRQLPLWPVVVSSRCLRLASAPPWEHHPPLIRLSADNRGVCVCVWECVGVRGNARECVGVRGKVRGNALGVRGNALGMRGNAKCY
jgi:hypothetical protein